MARVLITTTPFGLGRVRPLSLLADLDVDVHMNQSGARLSEEEMVRVIGDTEILIAGTEPISARVLDAAPNLRLIARVGVGLDNVDLLAARGRGIEVTYTPEAPAPAVADLTVASIWALSRFTHEANVAIRRGAWKRLMGRRIGDLSVGVIGVGRIGSRVVNLLTALGVQKILVNDLNPDQGMMSGRGLTWVSKHDIFTEADVVTLHLPLTQQTKNLVQAKELELMKPGAFLVNTSRGGIVNENDLAKVLTEGQLGGAAVDVFVEEPYTGPLIGLEQCLLTCHMGSMSTDCRSLMEQEATTEASRFLRGEALIQKVPDSEYALQAAHKN